MMILNDRNRLRRSTMLLGAILGVVAVFYLPVWSYIVPLFPKPTANVQYMRTLQYNVYLDAQKDTEITVQGNMPIYLKRGVITEKVSKNDNKPEGCERGNVNKPCDEKLGPDILQPGNWTLESTGEMQIIAKSPIIGETPQVVMRPKLNRTSSYSEILNARWDQVSGFPLRIIGAIWPMLGLILLVVVGALLGATVGKIFYYIVFDTIIDYRNSYKKPTDTV